MGEPRNAIGLAAARRVLNKIVAPWAFASRSHDQLPYRVELMVAWEDHGLSRDPTMSPTAIIHFLLFLFEKHEMAENIEQTLALEHLLPKVTCAIAGLMNRISCATHNLAG